MSTSSALQTAPPARSHARACPLPGPERHPLRVGAASNAGLPRNVNGVATYDLTPEALADFKTLHPATTGCGWSAAAAAPPPGAHRGGEKRLDGGAAQLSALGPTTPRLPGQATSLYISVPLTQDPGPLIIGERSNATRQQKKFHARCCCARTSSLVEVGRGADRRGRAPFSMSASPTSAATGPGDMRSAAAPRRRSPYRS